MMKMKIVLFVILASFGIPSMLCGQLGAHGHKVYVDTIHVRITYDDRAAITTGVLNQLLTSPIVFGSAVRETNGRQLAEELSGEIYLMLGERKLTPVVALSLAEHTDARLKGGVEFGSINLNLDDNAPREGETPIDSSNLKALASRFIEALRKHFQIALKEVVRRDVDEQFRRELESLARERELANQATAELKEKRKQLAELSAGIPQSVLEESVSNLQRQQQALELELAGMKGRGEAVQQRLSRSADQVKKDENADEVVQNLARVVKLRTQQLERYRQLHKSAAVSEAEVLKAEEDVALAQVELAQAKRLAVKGKTDEADRLNSQLADVAISVSEAQTKLQFVEKRLEENLEKLRRESTVAAPLREEIQAASAVTQQMLQEVRRRESQIRSLEASFKPTSVETFGRLRVAEEGSKVDVRKDK
jgi:hypothetical protein